MENMLNCSSHLWAGPVVFCCVLAVIVGLRVLVQKLWG